MNFEIAPRSAEVHTTYANALLHVMFCKINGKTGWRIPTKEECEWIFANPLHPKDRLFRSVYWTGEHDNSDDAYSFNFLTGTSNVDDKKYHNFVRPVRTITLEG